MAQDIIGAPQHGEAMAQVLIAEDRVETRGPRGPSPRRPVSRRLSTSSRGSSPARSLGPEDSPESPCRRVSLTSSEAPHCSSEAEEGGNGNDAGMEAQIAASCASTLEHVRRCMVGTENPLVAASPGAEVEAQQQARRALLEEKRVLGNAMEELRSTMRGLQEDGERCIHSSRTSASRLLASRALTSASQDEVNKVKGQLRRSREQVAEHVEATMQLREELQLCAGAFSDAVSQEADAHVAMRQEVEQLTQVTEDLEARLRAKSHDIAKAKEANLEAASRVAAALEQWATSHRTRTAAIDQGPLGDCLDALRSVASGQPSQRTRTSGAAQVGATGPSAPPSEPKVGVQQDIEVLDVTTLRFLVTSKEEQLAALHRKIRFLTESGP